MINRTVGDAPRRRLLGFVCLALLCGILYAGLTPFHSPTNDVSWIADANALRFGEHGTIFSSEPFSPPADGERSIEVVAQPGKIEDSNTLIAFYDPASLRHISIRQDESDLVVYIEPSDAWRYAKTDQLYAPDAFRDGRLAVWTVTFGPSGTAIYRNGALVTKSALRATAAELGGQLIVSGSPIYNQSWSGVLRGLAIYDSTLTPAQVAGHFASWANGMLPTSDPGERRVGLYVFNEGWGDVAHNSAGSGHDLYIPPRYMVLRKTLLDPVWRAFNWKWGFWQDAAINVGGFIPAGCFFCAWFGALGFTRPVIRTVVFGAGLSLLIEVTQRFLPSRDSSMDDVINNTLGTMIGALLYRGWIARSIEWGISGIARVLE
jgi:hypothetical protein